MSKSFVCPVHGLVKAKPASFKRVVMVEGKEVKEQMAGYKCEVKDCNIYRQENELEYPEG